MFRACGKGLIRDARAGFDGGRKPRVSAPERRTDLGKSQLERIQRFGCALAQGRGGELFQLGISAAFGEDAFPFAVARLLLEKTREIYDLAGFVFGQSVHDTNQFLRCRTHAGRLNRLPIPCNYESIRKLFQQFPLPVHQLRCVQLPVARKVAEDGFGRDERRI